MAVGTLATLTNSIKLAYPTKYIEPLVNNETTFRNWLSKSIPSGAVYTEGKVQFAFNLNPPKNVAQILDGDQLVAPKDRTDIQGSITPRIYTGSFQVGWMTKKVLGSNVVAFNGGELQRRTEETITDTAKFMEQSMAGAWKFGSRSTVEADGANTITLAAPLRALLVDENMRITVVTAGGSVEIENRLVTAVNKDTGVVTYDGADGTGTAGSFVYVVQKSGLTLANMQNAAGYSLTELVDDGTVQDDLHGQSRTTYPKLKAQVSSSASNRPLSEALIINMCHKIRQACGKRPTDAWSNTGQAEKWVEMVAPAVRIMQSGGSITPKLTGYEDDSLVHKFPGGSLKLNISTDIIPRSMFIVTKSTLFHYKAQSLDWWDEGNMLKPLPGSQTYFAAFFAALAAFENIGTDYPIANGVIRNLVDPLLGDVNP